MSEQAYFEAAARMHAKLKRIEVDADTTFDPRDDKWKTWDSTRGTSSIATFREPNTMTDQNAHLITHVHPSAVIDCPDVQIGDGVSIGANVRIKADTLRIGDFVQIGDGCKFFVPELRIGDYSRLGDLVLGIGTKPMLLGRNLYIGRLVRLDSRGGLTVEDNVGIGDSSAIWTHIRHGDTVQGCRWDKEYPLVIEHDAWLVAKVTVGGCQRIGARAMIFNESNVTKREIPADTTWKGNNPIENVTESVGPQFETISNQDKWERLNAEIKRFEAEHPQYMNAIICVAEDPGVLAPLMSEGVTILGCFDRVYVKRRTAAEVAFLRFTLAKFTPLGEN